VLRHHHDPSFCVHSFSARLLLPRPRRFRRLAVRPDRPDGSQIRDCDAPGRDPACRISSCTFCKQEAFHAPVHGEQGQRPWRARGAPQAFRHEPSRRPRYHASVVGCGRPGSPRRRRWRRSFLIVALPWTLEPVDRGHGGIVGPLREEVTKRFARRCRCAAGVLVGVCACRALLDLVFGAGRCPYSRLPSISSGRALHWSAQLQSLKEEDPPREWSAFFEHFGSSWIEEGNPLCPKPTPGEKNATGGRIDSSHLHWKRGDRRAPAPEWDAEINRPVQDPIFEWFASTPGPRDRRPWRTAPMGSCRKKQGCG